MESVMLYLQIFTVFLLVMSFVVMIRLKTSYDKKFNILREMMERLRDLLFILQRKGLSEDEDIRKKIIEINDKTSELERYQYSSIYERLINPHR